MRKWPEQRRTPEIAISVGSFLRSVSQQEAWFVCGTAWTLNRCYYLLLPGPSTATATDEWPSEHMDVDMAMEMSLSKHLDGWTKKIVIGWGRYKFVAFSNCISRLHWSTALNAPINRGEFIDHFKYFVLVVVRCVNCQAGSREMRYSSGNRRATESDKNAQIKRRRSDGVYCDRCNLLESLKWGNLRVAEMGDEWFVNRMINDRFS